MFNENSRKRKTRGFVLPCNSPDVVRARAVSYREKEENEQTSEAGTAGKIVICAYECFKTAAKIRFIPRCRLRASNPRFTAEKLRPAFSVGALRKKKKKEEDSRCKARIERRERERERERSLAEGNAAFVNVSSSFPFLSCESANKVKDGFEAACRYVNLSFS